MSRPPDSRIGVTTVLFALFLFANLPFFADAQQQRSPQQKDAYSQLQRGKSTWTEAQDDTADVLGHNICLLYTSPSPRDGLLSRMPSSA